MAFDLKPFEPLTPLKEMQVMCPKSQVSSMPLLFGDYYMKTCVCIWIHFNMDFFLEEAKCSVSNQA